MKYYSFEYKSILRDILFTILTLGLWNLWVQCRQINTVNRLLEEDSLPAPVVVFLLALLTFGIYFIYHEIRMTRYLHQLEYRETFILLELGCGVCTFFGLWFVVDSYQQHLINQIVNARYPTGEHDKDS